MVVEWSRTNGGAICLPHANDAAAKGEHTPCSYKASFYRRWLITFLPYLSRVVVIKVKHHQASSFQILQIVVVCTTFMCLAFIVIYLVCEDVLLLYMFV